MKDKVSLSMEEQEADQTEVTRKVENQISDDLIVVSRILVEDDEDEIDKFKEFQSYLDLVKRRVRAGCSPELLKVVLETMCCLVNTLTCISQSRTLCMVYSLSRIASHTTTECLGT